MSISNEHLFLLRESVAASNRTTRAVRALVRFIFIQLSSTTLAGILVYFGTVNSELSLLILGIIVWVVGVFWSSAAGWSELDKSDPRRQESGSRVSGTSDDVSGEVETVDFRKEGLSGLEAARLLAAENRAEGKKSR
jgi:hypothetical protein